MTPPCPNCKSEEVTECIKDAKGNVIRWCCEYCNLVWGCGLEGRTTMKGPDQVLPPKT